MGFSLLPSDIILFILFWVWLLDSLLCGRPVRAGPIGKGILIFMGAALVSFLLNCLRFPFAEMLRAGAYLGRLFLYLSLYFVVYNGILAHKIHSRSSFILLWCMGGCAAFLALLGFLQLFYFPSFLDLGLDLYGWDPHDFRLLSTWFDPNFLAGFLAFNLSVLTTLYFSYQNRSGLRFLLFLLALIILTALYFTYSRSGYLAFGAGLGIWAVLRSPKLLPGILLIVLAGTLFSSRFQQRLTLAWQSGQTLIGLDTQYALDPTAQFRVESWSHALEMIQEHPWIGIGYNRYPFELNQRGYALLGDHAAGGSDSSLLTLWATTGLFGLLSYLAIFIIAAVQGFKTIYQKKSSERVFSIGLLSCMTILLVHSVFVNSLLFPWMMIYLWTLMALADRLNHS